MQTKGAKISGFSKDSSFPPSMLVHKTHKTHRFSTHKFMLCDLSVGWGISFSKGCLWLPYISNCGHVRQWRKRKVNLQQLKLSSCSRNPYDITQLEQRTLGMQKMKRVPVISWQLHGEKWVLDPREVTSWIISKAGTTLKKPYSSAIG